MTRTLVREYDLRDPVEHLWGLEGYDYVLVLVRSGGEPMGIVTLPIRRGMVTIPARDLEDIIESQLGVFPSLHASWGSGRAAALAFPAISVAVCTRDQARSLARCLATLERVTYGGDMEVIVVDNASRDASTREVVARTPFRYVREGRPGLNWARNRAAQEARHEFIAYVDDDVQVDSGWLTGIARGFRDISVDGVTGLVLPAELETRAQHLFQLYGHGMCKGTQARRFDRATLSPSELIASHRVGVGANMAFRQDALKRINGFDTALDVGTPSRGGGDLDVFHRILASGGVIQYEPLALAWHQDRRDMAGLSRQLSDNGRGFGVYLLTIWRAGRISRSQTVSYAVWTWGRWLLGRPILRLLQRHRLPLLLLVAELWGALQAPWAFLATYRSDQKIRQTPYP